MPTTAELVVADDGSIPAEQLERFGLQPGARLRVVEAPVSDVDVTSLAGSLRDLPDLGWEAFQKGSELAQRDLAGAE